MFCEKCGNKVPDGAKFCDSCGASLQLTGTAPDSGYQQGMDGQQNADYQQSMDGRQDADYQQGMGYQQNVDYQQGTGYQQDANYQQGMGYQHDVNYQQGMGYQQDANYQQGMGYQQNMNYQQQYAPRPPRKPIPKKYLIIGGAVAAACLMLAIAIPLISSAVQSSKDKKNAELYEQYVEELETTNQQAAQEIMNQIAGTTGSDDAKKK